MDLPKADTCRKPQMKPAKTRLVKNLETNNVPNVKPVVNHGTTEEAKDGYWPLSGKPFFSVIIGKSQITPLYQLCVPAKVHRELPNVAVPVVLNYCGKSWKMIYDGNKACKRFDPRWKNFVIDNNLKVGDACVFELTECNNSQLKFRVQILRGDFPSELLTKTKGSTSNAPINID